MDWKKSTDTDSVTVIVRGKVRNSRLNGFEARSVEIQKAIIPEVGNCLLMDAVGDNTGS